MEFSILLFCLSCLFVSSIHFLCLSLCSFGYSRVDFLLHPFRKPKRVRTAFSPGQLLKLEHAFESNQYVVGAERKALAQALNLSETQVSACDCCYCVFCCFFVAVDFSFIVFFSLASSTSSPRCRRWQYILFYICIYYGSIVINFQFG